MKKSILTAAVAGNQAKAPLSMSYDVSKQQQQMANQQQNAKQSSSLNTRKTLTNFQIQPQTTTTQQQPQFDMIKDVNTRKSVDFKQFQRKNEPSVNKLTISSGGGGSQQQQHIPVQQQYQSQRVSPDSTLMFQNQQQTSNGGHKKQLSMKQGGGVPIGNSTKFAKQPIGNIFYPVANNSTIEANQQQLQVSYNQQQQQQLGQNASNGKYDSRHSLHIQNKYSSSGAPSYANSQERVNASKQNPAERAALLNRVSHQGGNVNDSINFGQVNSGKAASSLPPSQGKGYAAYAAQGPGAPVNPSPNIVNRPLSLSTNLGKPGQGGGVTGYLGMQGPQAKHSKQQSIQNIYLDKNQPPVMMPYKQAMSAQGAPIIKGVPQQLSQSIDLYKHQNAATAGLIYNGPGMQTQGVGHQSRLQEMQVNSGANSALGHAQNVLLLSEQNNNTAYIRQKKTAGTGKYASQHYNTPQINTPNRSIDFSTKAATFFVGNNSSQGTNGSNGYQFKNQPIKIGGQVNTGTTGHKKNAMSLLDYQQLNSSFLDQNLSSIMQQPPTSGLGIQQAPHLQQHRRDFQDISPAAMIAGRFSVQQRPVHGNFTPDLIGKYTNPNSNQPGFTGQPQQVMGQTFQQQLYLQQQQQMMKLNQSMNSNYGSNPHQGIGMIDPMGHHQQQQIMISKQKKRKGGSGLHAHYAKTPLEFESSLSSNSNAHLMMDGGTGSEGIISMQQQQLMQQMGIQQPYNGANLNQQPQTYNKKMILRQSQQQPVMPQQQQLMGPQNQQVFAGTELSSQKGSKISINSLQKSKDRIHQMKQQQEKMKQVAPNYAPVSVSAVKAQQRYGALQESVDQLDKLCVQDVSLSKDGPPQSMPKKIKAKVQSKTTINPTANSTLRKSINITEEALAIGKVPPEQIARMVASNQINNHNIQNFSPRTREMAIISRAIRECFHQMQEAPDTTTDFYRAGKMLGRGAFGKVCLGMHKLTRKLVAIKSINKEYLSEEKQKNKVMHEVGILLRLNRHPNVVKLFETFETGRHILLVMELCAGGDLLNYVRKRKKLEEDSAKYLFKQLIEGLGYLHSKNILHRDIKLDNILLDGKGQVKIADFGVSKLVRQGEVMREQCGTPAYIAPEIIRDRGYTGFKADLWSAGVVLYAMLYGTVPFKANNMQDLHKLILQAKYNLKEEISEDAKHLLRSLLEPDPVKRLTVKQILNHRWLQDAPDETTPGFQVFNQEEQEIIRREFTYNNPSRFNRNEVPQNPDQEPWDCFTELNLDSMNATLRNASTKSVILAPFNSSVSDDREFETVNKRQAPMIDKKSIVKFAARCRDQDRQYEINNNCELDNGVYHKFVYSSHDGQGGAPAGEQNGAKKQPSGGQSPGGGDDEANNNFDVYNNIGDSPIIGKTPIDRQALADDGALSTKMKQSTRNGGNQQNQESFIQSFEQPDNYEDIERRIQSAKLDKRATHQLLPVAHQVVMDVQQAQNKDQKQVQGKAAKGGGVQRIMNEPSSIEGGDQPNMDDSDNFSSNYSFVIEPDRVQVMVDFGFPQEYVYKCLQDNEANYCTSGYYLLGLDQNY